MRDIRYHLAWFPTGGIGTGCSSPGKSDGTGRRDPSRPRRPPGPTYLWSLTPLYSHQVKNSKTAKIRPWTGEAAAEEGKGVAILIDEVQFLAATQLEALIQSIHKTVQRKLPVTFVGAGLPQIAELAGDAKSYAERLFKFPRIDSLDDTDARTALTEPAAAEGAVYDGDAADLAVDITRGYPYFIQELGHQVWNIARNNRITREDVTLAQEAYEAKLDSSFFRVRLDRATPLQTAYMRAMAELGPEPQ